MRFYVRTFPMASKKNYEISENIQKEYPDLCDRCPHPKKYKISKKNI